MRPPDSRARRGRPPTSACPVRFKVDPCAGCGTLAGCWGEARRAAVRSERGAYGGLRDEHPPNPPVPYACAGVVQCLTGERVGEAPHMR